MCKGALKTINAYGITCTSRHGLKHELNLMKGIANLLVRFEKPVTEIWCDSSVTCQYVVQISIHDTQVAYDVACLFDGLVTQFAGGHNGIIVKAEQPDVVLYVCEADWSFYEMFEQGVL